MDVNLQAQKIDELTSQIAQTENGEFATSAQLGMITGFMSMLPNTPENQSAMEKFIEYLEKKTCAPA